MERVLVVVDIQSDFNKFIQFDLVEGINDYCNKFGKVYQIWDSHKSKKPSYKFPNEVGDVPKLFGKNHFSDDVKEFIDNIEDSSDEGRTFKLSDGGYVVRIDNNHDWFYVNPEIVDLIFELKDNDVILVGGADDECLEDVYQSFLAFGIQARINDKYVYSAKTRNHDSIDDTNESVIMKFNDFIKK